MREVVDIFADELDRIEMCGGGNCRLVYVTYYEGRKQVVARLIRPVASLQGLQFNCERLQSLFQQARAHHVLAPELH